jgi:hypothetical protein
MGLSSTRHQAYLMQTKVTQKNRRPNGNYTHGEHQWGVVAAINDGPPPTVDVYLNGMQNDPTDEAVTPELNYLSSYVPAVGDVVLVQRGAFRNRSDRVVLGKLNGSPSPYPTLLGNIDPASGRYVQGPNALWGGSGAPSTEVGIVGDFYFRTDAAANNNNWVYQKNNLIWENIAPNNTYTENYLVPGTIAVVSGATNYLAPFFVSVPTGYEVTLTSVYSVVRSGSCAIQFKQNGNVIPFAPSASPTNSISVTTTPSETIIGQSFVDGDSLAPLVASASSADNLSLTFVFTVN